MFLEEPLTRHMVSWPASSQTHPTAEHGGHLSDIPHSQSQHASDNLSANELFRRGEDVFGMESVCIEDSQVKTGCFLT